jgi:drug/metabolite transporter (DMT)-like permease
LTATVTASRTRTAAWLLVAAAAIWGASFTLVKDALADCSPLLFNLLRMTLAAAILLVLERGRWRTLPRQAWLGGIAVGIFLAAGYQFQTVGLTRTTPAKSAFITGLVVVIAPFLLLLPRVRRPGQRVPGPGALAGALSGFAGLILLTTPAGALSSIAQQGGTAASNAGTGVHPAAIAGFVHAIGVGDLLTLVCAFAFAGHLVTLARVSPSMPARQLAALQVSACAVCMLLTLPLETGSMHLRLTPRLVIALLVTSVLATAAAFTVQSFAQRHLRASSVALLLTMEPIFAWLTALLLLGEHMQRRTLLGAGLILAGVVVTELTESRRNPETLMLVTPDTPLPQNAV